jgi:hypothetical protein
MRFIKILLITLIMVITTKPLMASVQNASSEITCDTDDPSSINHYRLYIQEAHSVVNSPCWNIDGYRTTTIFVLNNGLELFHYSDIYNHPESALSYKERLDAMFSIEGESSLGSEVYLGYAFHYDDDFWNDFELMPFDIEVYLEKTENNRRVVEMFPQIEKIEVLETVHEEDGRNNNWTWTTYQLEIHLSDGTKWLKDYKNTPPELFRELGDHILVVFDFDDEDDQLSDVRAELLYIDEDFDIDRMYGFEFIGMSE